MSILQLGSDTLAVTPVSGQMEYNGTIQTFTPLGTQRGIVPAEQFYSVYLGLAGANATGAQSLLGVGVTLSSSTQYEFEISTPFNRASGATSHTIALGFGGTATITACNYAYSYLSNITGISGNAMPAGAGFVGSVTSAASTVITPAISSAVFGWLLIKGTVSINVGGTFIPQYTLSVAPGGAYTTASGNYMKIKPIGVAGANVSVGTWA